MGAFEVVRRSAVPEPLSLGPDFAGKVFAALLEVKGDQALKVTVPGAKSGYHLRKRLQKIADAEHVGLAVFSSRTKDGKTFYFWFEAKEMR